MTPETDGKILRRLDEWQAGPEALPAHLALCLDLVRCRTEAAQVLPAPAPRLSAGEAGRRLAAGLPLLTFDDIDVDWSLLPDMFCEVVAVFSRYPQVFGDWPVSLLGTTPSVSWFKEAARASFDQEELPPLEAGSEVDAGNLSRVVLASMKPVLIGNSRAVAGLVTQEGWRRGYCPFCGGNADFAWLDKESGARWLLCSRCDSEWLFQRLQCPFCDTAKPGLLSFLTDERGLYRLYLCDACKSYLKAIDLRQADYEVLPPLERYVTLPYDTQALSEGYVPGDRRKIEREAPALKQ